LVSWWLCGELDKAYREDAHIPNLRVFESSSLRGEKRSLS
jgi:hypothetical protein